MKRFWVTALTIGTMVSSTMVLADPWDDHHRGGGYRDDGPPQRYYEPPRPPHWGPQPYWNNGYGYHRHHDYPVRYWHEGQRLPPEYFNDRYYVDWRNNELPPPPYGHRWMRINGDFVLVAVASSLITQILLGPHY